MRYFEPDDVRDTCPAPNAILRLDLHAILNVPGWWPVLLSPGH